MSSTEFRIGQVWIDRDPRSIGRELVVESADGDLVRLRSTEGRATRVAARRLCPPRYQLATPPGRYVRVPSESGEGGSYNVWTGDPGSPAHCPCENFREALREPYVQYLCEHLRLALGVGGMS